MRNHHVTAHVLPLYVIDTNSVKRKRNLSLVDQVSVSMLLCFARDVIGKRRSAGKWVLFDLSNKEQTANVSYTVRSLSSR